MTKSFEKKRNNLVGQLVEEGGAIVTKVEHMKKVAIVQSNYLPWKGYFDLIAQVDEFIILDSVQYTKRDWRNRNRIKTPKGLEWLTVPVAVKGRYHQMIKDVEISGAEWIEEHWRAFFQNYRRSNYFEDIIDLLSPIYTDEIHTNLSTLNYSITRLVCQYLDIGTKLSLSGNFDVINGPSERLVNLCVQANADVYVSGPSAKDYLNASLFQRQGIDVYWFNYDGYPEYPQLWGEFVHSVSIIDLLFNCGPESRIYF